MDMNKMGVYCIKNTITNKKYIGSSTVTINKRCQHHIYCLKNNKHKNSHLQHSWNKYGSDKFDIIVLENVEHKEKVLEREQYYIDNEDFENLYNINPIASGTPNMSKEVIEKRRNTMLRKYRNGELDYMKEILRNRTPWNKGLTKDKFDYSFLKGVKKTISQKVLDARAKIKQERRDNQKDIYVYKNKTFLGKFNSAKDIEELSLDNYFPTESRFKGNFRLSKPSYYLCSGNIMKSCKSGKPYKKLTFSHSPLD